MFLLRKNRPRRQQVMNDFEGPPISARTRSQTNRVQLPLPEVIVLDDEEEEEEEVVIVEELLPGQKRIQQPNVTCTICLDRLPLHSAVPLIPCLHEFHSNCLSQWKSVCKPPVHCPICISEL